MCLGNGLDFISRLITTFCLEIGVFLLYYAFWHVELNLFGFIWPLEGLFFLFAKGS